MKKISLDSYASKLETTYLPPSRMLLKEHIEENFNYFRQIGISNLDELLSLLKKKEYIEVRHKLGCLQDEYLTVLLRELKSLMPNPNSIKDFTGISKDTITKLKEQGIVNTRKLFDKVLDINYRKELAKKTGISYAEILKLTHLTDLSRIKWVGTTFAHILYELGFDTIKKVSKANPIGLHSEINQFIKERNIYKGSIGLNDIKILIDAAKEVPLEIVYE